jgi:cytochrome b561
MSTTHTSDGSGAARDRYTRVAIALHWAIAAFIIFNLATGFFMEGWPPPVRMLALMLHASSGMTVLVLTVARVAWRLLNEPPPYPEDMKPWERHAAHFAHFFLYAAMVLMPLTGWAVLSAHAPPGSAGAVAEFAAPPAMPPGMKPGMAPGGPPPGAMGARPTKPPPPLKLWGVATMPRISAIEEIAREPAGVPAQRVLHDEFVDWHGVGGWLLLALLVLHVLGALKHQFMDKHAEFERMSFRRRKTP